MDVEAPVAAPSPTLIDSLMPKPDFAERHEIDVAAPPAAVWRTWRGMGLGDAPRIARVMLGARGVLARLRHGHAQADIPRTFIPLAEEEPYEIVEGAVGRWWALGAHANHDEITGPDGFLAFGEPGYAKATVGMRFVDLGDGRTRVVTETRLLCTDDSARRVMGRYWLLIRPFSGLLRVALLRRLRARTLR